jgi:O-antigen/teichoic acid export membrane protein
MDKESSKIASNTISQIIGRVFVLAASLVSVKLITNYLGPAGTGYYNTVITYLSFFIVLADFGFFSVVVREISKFPEKAEEILANVFSIRFITAVLAVLVSIAIVYLTSYPPEIKEGVIIASLFPIFNLGASIYDMLFQARLKMQKVAMADVLSKVIALTGVWLSVYFHLGFYYVLSTVSLAAVFSFIFKAFFARSELKIGFKFNWPLIKRITLMSLPLGIVFIVNNIYFRVDSLILFYYKGAYDAGIYSVSYNVLSTSLFAGSFLATSLKPLFSTTIETNKERAEKALTYAITFLLYIAFIITAVSVTFSREIILFISSKEFLLGAPILIILSFAALLIYVNGIFGEIMIARDLRKTLIKMSLFILAFNVGLNLYLIPHYSYYGAAWATTVSEMILFTMGLIVSKRVINVYFDWKRISKLILLSLMTMGLASLLRLAGVTFLINLGTDLIFYALTTYYFDAVPQGTVREYLKIVVNKWNSLFSR